MATRAETKEIRDVIGALGVAGVSCPEIRERLASGNAGLKHKVKLSLRSVQYHWRNYQIKHEAELKKDDKAESIEAVKARSVAVIAREIGALERRRPGTLTVMESKALGAHHKTLDGMAKVERKLLPGRPKQYGASASTEEPAQPESPLQRLVREEAEGPLQTAPQTEQSATSSEQGVGPSQGEEDVKQGVEPRTGGRQGGQSWSNTADDPLPATTDHQASDTTPAEDQDQAA